VAVAVGSRVQKVAAVVVVVDSIMLFYRLVNLIPKSRLLSERGGPLALPPLGRAGTAVIHHWVL